MRSKKCDLKFLSNDDSDPGGEVYLLHLHETKMMENIKYLWETSTYQRWLIIHINTTFFGSTARHYYLFYS